MWISTRECVPLGDGEYFVQTVYGSVHVMQYTFKGGWNTYYNDGELVDKLAMPDSYVVRWYLMPDPPKVPDEWYNKYKKEVIK